MNEHLAIEDLMTIDSRRQDGSSVAPPMRRDFALKGPMTLTGGTLLTNQLAVDDVILSISGLPLGFTIASS
jgi:hypothetical protein